MAGIPILQSHETVETHDIPDLQSATEQYAASANSLSAIGARVAQSASNQMAVQLGTEEGKTPHGDLLPPITEFDSHFADSYHAQAGAVLSQQGNELLSSAQIEMAKANRLTPELIAKTHNHLKLGLDKIAEQAPTAIKVQLQESFNSQLLNHTTQSTEKMISQQKEDEKNNIQNGIDVGIKNALELSQNNDPKAAKTNVDAVKKLADNGLANRFLTPEEARIAKETAEQAAINGTAINAAMAAEKQGKLAEFEKQFAENKPANWTNEQHFNAGQAVEKQMQFLQGLRQQDENLKAQDMMNQIATDPTRITGTEWASFEASVSPIKADQVKFRYIQALKSANNKNADIDNLIPNFGNPEAMAAAPEKVKNAAFNRQVDYAVNQGAKTGKVVSHEDAEVQVAASAGGRIPVFINGLKNKLSSANPAMIESAGQQIHALYAMGAGRAITGNDGLNEKDLAAYTKYESLRDSMQPTDAAREMTNEVFNQDPDVQKANDEKWSSQLRQTSTAGIPLPTYALTAVGLSNSDFINPSMAQVYGTEILSKYKTYYQILNGDNDNALKLTKQFVNQNYGDTGVNGGTYKTLHPIEKLVGFQDSSGVPYIQQDVINQLQPNFDASKKAYDAKTSNEYWEAISGKPQESRFQPLYMNAANKDYSPIQLKRHSRLANGTAKEETFNVVLQGNAFDSYDVAVDSGSGMRNLFQIAPFLGVITYKPDIKSIRDKYNKDHGFK